MIPISLKIKGLYSYRGVQEIDFRELTRASLFGIFGKVGSGKSTILDAILYALYKKVDRLDGNSMAYNLMNLRSNDIAIEFVFDVNGKKYISRVEGHRDKRNREKVNINRKIYEYTEGVEPIPATQTIEEILGLTFENFRRTIIIPQNKFQDFLTLGGKDRATMMKELFNLDKFELYDRVVKIQDKNKIELDSVKNSIIEIGDVSEQNIKNQNIRLKELLESINIQKTVISDKSNAEKEISGLKEKFDTLNKLNNDLNKLLSQQERYKQLEQEISLFDFCEKHFKALFDDQKTNNLRLINAVEDIQKKKQEQIELKTLIEKEKEQIEKLRPEYELLDKRQKQAAEFRQLIGIEQQKKLANKLFISAQNGRKTVNSIEQTLNELKLKYKTDEDILEKMRHSMPDFDTLTKVSDWFSKKENYAADVLKIQKKIEFSDAKITDLRQRKIKLVSQNEQFMIANDTPIDTIIHLLENKKSEAENIIRKTFAQQHLIDISQKMSATEPCLLCGSVHHPLLLHTRENNIKPESFESQIIDFQNFTIKTDTLIRQFEKLKTEYQLICTEKTALQTELNNANEIQRRWAQNFNFDGFKPDFPEQVAQERERFQQLKKAISDAEIALKKISHSLESEIKKREKCLQENQKNNDEYIRIESEIKTLTNQITNLPLDKLANVNETELLKKALQLDEHIEKTKRDYSFLEKKQHERALQLERLTGSIELQNDVIIALQELLKNISNQILLALQTYNYEYSKVEQILNQKPKTQSDRQQLDSYKKNLFSTEKQYTELQEILRGITYNSETHKALIIEIEQLTNDLQNKNREVGGLRQLIDKMNKDFEKLQYLEIQNNDLLAREDDLKVLASLFRGNAFVDFVSGMHLQNICSAANTRFKQLTRQSMELQLNSKNEFEILDVINDGQIRSIKTLSGGQIFQASLCLALALTDNIQATTKSKQNFFFLDEGFGSLDKESLKIVFETLKALRKENRIVGIISHVEEMRLEIERYLEVSLSESTGSQVNLVIG